MSDNIEKHKITKICFFFPYRNVSGVPVLFYRLANEIAGTNQNINIYIIDYVDGVMSTNVNSLKNIIIIPFKDGITVSPPPDCILVMQSILPYSIRPELKISPLTKLVFWTLHPDNLVPNLFPVPYFGKFVRKNFLLYKFLAQKLNSNLISNLNKFIKICYDNSGLWFMDMTNLSNTNKHLFSNIKNINFLPVPSTSLHKKISRNGTINKDEIQFCWVGRLCDFKIHILIYTMKELSKISKELNIKINFNIIGDGEEKNRIDSLDLKNDYFQFNYFGAMNPSDLNEFLLKKVDVLAAMGTSALEGAKMSIPTLLLDYSYFKIKDDYIFRWLFSTTNYDLGHEIKSDDIKKGNQSLRKIIFDITNNYKLISSETYNYFEKNHNLSNISILFLEKLSQTKLTFSDFPSHLFKKNLLRKIYEFKKGFR